MYHISYIIKHFAHCETNHLHLNLIIFLSSMSLSHSIFDPKQKLTFAPFVIILEYWLIIVPTVLQTSQQILKVKNHDSPNLYS
jgi:hypothetical protein